MFIVPVEGDNPTRHRHLVLWTVIGINVLVFAISELLLDHREILNEYGFIPSAASSLTLVTSMFLHGGFLHLLGNMFFLWMFGDNIEDVTGGLVFLGAYALCGVAAVAAYFPFHMESTIPLVGASGAISGIVGMYLVFFPKVRAELCIYLFRFEVATIPTSIRWAVLVWFAEQIVLAVAAEMTSLGNIVRVAFSAHVGGFLTGCLVGWVLLQLGFVGRYFGKGKRHWLLGYVT